MTTTELEAGLKVRIVLPADSPFREVSWIADPDALTGTVQRVFKNGKVAVAVDQLRTWDSKDGLRTLHFAQEEVEPVAS